MYDDAFRAAAAFAAGADGFSVKLDDEAHLLQAVHTVTVGTALAVADGRRRRRQSPAVALARGRSSPTGRSPRSRTASARCSTS